MFSVVDLALGKAGTCLGQEIFRSGNFWYKPDLFFEIIVECYCILFFFIDILSKYTRDTFYS